MLVPAVSLLLRWILVTLTESPTLVFASNLLHGGGFIVLHLTLARYVADTVEPGLHATGQAMVSAVLFSMSRAMGLVGGSLAEGCARIWEYGASTTVRAERRVCRGCRHCARTHAVLLASARAVPQGRDVRCRKHEPGLAVNKKQAAHIGAGESLSEDINYKRFLSTMLRHFPSRCRTCS